MLACVLFKPILKIKIYIHEQNCVVGRTNKFFLKFADKIFLNFDIKSKISYNLQDKTFVVGLPEKKTKYLDKNFEDFFGNNFLIFVFGGSQGSKYVTEFATQLIKIINKEKIINAKFIIQCPTNLISQTSNNLKKIEKKIIIKNYFDNIEEILHHTSIAISRAGAGSIRDLINYNVPSVLIPLPTAKDNHQYDNASIMTNIDVAISINEKKNELNKAKNYIYNIYNSSQQRKLLINKFNKIKVKNSNSLIYRLINNG